MAYQVHPILWKHLALMLCVEVSLGITLLEDTPSSNSVWYRHITRRTALPEHTLNVSNLMQICL